MDLGWQRVNGSHLLIALKLKGNDVKRAVQGLPVSANSRLPETKGKVHLYKNYYQRGHMGEIQALQIIAPDIEVVIPQNFDEDSFYLMGEQYYTVRTQDGRSLDMSVGIRT